MDDTPVAPINPLMWSHESSTTFTPHHAQPLSPVPMPSVSSECQGYQWGIKWSQPRAAMAQSVQTRLEAECQSSCWFPPKDTWSATCWSLNQSLPGLEMRLCTCVYDYAHIALVFDIPGWQVGIQNVSSFPIPSSHSLFEVEQMFEATKEEDQHKPKPTAKQ